MLNASRLYLSIPNPQAKLLLNCNFKGNGLSLRLPHRRNFASFTGQSVAEEVSVEPLVNSGLTSTVGFSSGIQQPFTPGHIRILSFFACAAALSATWLFCAAIPALLAFKRAAESMEKLMDVTREELPDTMAAVRLSGMEISDLTMELSDLGQEITQGVRRSTRAVRLAEERLRRLTNMSAPTAYVQVVAPIETKTMKLVLLANTVRGVREGIVKGRSVVRIFFTLTHFSKMVFNFLKSRSKA